MISEPARISASPADESAMDSSDVFSCDCGCWNLGGRWLIGAIVFEGVGVIVLAILLYNMFQMLKGSK